MSLYLAAYDISADRRRAQVADVLKRRGRRIQESVFELILEPDDLIDLRRTLGPILAPGDRFDIVPVDERGTRRRWSWMREPETWQPVVLR